MATITEKWFKRVSEHHQCSEEGKVHPVSESENNLQIQRHAALTNCMKFNEQRDWRGRGPQSEIITCLKAQRRKCQYLLYSGLRKQVARRKEKHTQGPENRHRRRGEQPDKVGGQRNVDSGNKIGREVT